MDQYEAPELFDLGEIADLTLGKLFADVPDGLPNRLKLIAVDLEDLPEE